MRSSSMALLAILLGSGALVPGAAAQAARDDQHVINLADVEVSAFIDDVAMLTGYTFIVHPSVTGRVTVSSQTELSTADLFQVFLSTLRVQGFVAIPDGRGVYRIVPEDVAASEGRFGSAAPSGFVTQAFRLEHFSAVEAAKMVKPLLGPQGRVVASPASNVLIVVEYGSNMGMVQNLLTAVDKDEAVTRTIALQTVPVGEMQAILAELQNIGGEAERSIAGRLSAIASPASNSIILRGEAGAVERAAALVAELDTSSPLRKDTRVLNLSHADAVLIEPILRQIAESEAAQSPEGGVSGVSTTIAVHEPTNSVIISAAPDTLGAMQSIVQELDVRRRQVLVEAIIVEVSDTVARELGLQFLVSGEDGNIPFASSTFSRAAPNLLALTGALTEVGGAGVDGSGSNVFEQAAIASLLGLEGGTFAFGGQSGETLFGVVLNAVERDTESNLLSTPSVMTLDNHTSTLSVGQEIPITSGEVLGDANLNPFRTVERREIGVLLTVTPKVGEDNTIRLDINQEVSSIASAIGTVTTDFILNLRQLETSVVVEDGEMIVLGGLIEAEDVLEADKVPLLGDIPGLGRLFKSDAKSRRTSNLMIFIRPTIVRNSRDAKAVTDRNYNFIRAQQIIANEDGQSSLDDYTRNLLGVEPPALPGTEPAVETPAG